MLRLVSFSEQYLDKSYEWLNDHLIQELTDGPTSVSREKQKEWYVYIQNDETYQIWGIEHDGNPIGACGIKNIDYENHSGEYWGYIGEKQAWGGKGHDLMQAIFVKAKELLLNKLDLFVLKTNHRAMHLYLNEGFEISYEDELKIYMNKQL